MNEGDTPQPGAGLDALRAALGAGDAAAALARFRALVLANPPEPSVKAWVVSAWSALRAGAEDADLPALVATARGDPVAALLLLARLALGAGQPAGAVAVARQAVEAAPDQPAPAFLLCALLLRQGDPDAQPLLRHCLERFPEPSPGWTELGEALLASGKREAALVCFARGTPSAALALRRGLLAREIGRPQQARDAFAEAVRHDPRAPRAWFLLGAAAQDARDFRAAADAYRAALALAPTLAEAAVNLGTALQETGDLAGAKAAYGRAVAIRPDTFGRVAQALTTSPKGELWLDLDALRRSLVG